jgi:hypothetical protein
MQDSMILEIAKNGILGIVIVILIFVVRKLYTDRETEREKHRAELAAQEDSCKKELAAWEERYRTKVETLEARHHDISRGLTAVLERLEKKFGRAGGKASNG